MTGMYSVIADAARGLFKLQEASRPWEDEKRPSNLSEKLADGVGAFRLDPEFVRGARAAKTALEEAKRIGGPKSAAKERMERVERRLKEIRQEARIAAARGDREKLAALAREAVGLARGAGRAAKEYAAGISAAAKMGVGGTETTAANGVVIESETRITQTTVSLTVRQDAFSLALSVSNGEGQEPTNLTYDTVSNQVALKVESLSASVGESLRATGMPIGGFSSLEGRQMLGAMIADGDLKMSRYREADAFARRVEAAIATAKNVLNEAKRAAETDPDARRRDRRREELDDLEKDLEEGRQAATDLRGVAMESGQPLQSIQASGPVSDPASGQGVAGIGASIGDVAPLLVDFAPAVDVSA